MQNIASLSHYLHSNEEVTALLHNVPVIDFDYDTLHI